MSNPGWNRLLVQSVNATDTTGASSSSQDQEAAPVKINEDDVAFVTGAMAEANLANNPEKQEPEPQNPEFKPITLFDKFFEFSGPGIVENLDAKDLEMVEDLHEQILSFIETGEFSEQLITPQAFSAFENFAIKCFDFPTRLLYLELIPDIAQNQEAFQKAANPQFLSKLIASLEEPNAPTKILSATLSTISAIVGNCEPALETFSNMKGVEILSKLVKTAGDPIMKVRAVRTATSIFFNFFMEKDARVKVRNTDANLTATLNAFIDFLCYSILWLRCTIFDMVAKDEDPCTRRQMQDVYDSLLNLVAGFDKSEISIDARKNLTDFRKKFGDFDKNEPTYAILRAHLLEEIIEEEEEEEKKKNKEPIKTKPIRMEHDLEWEQDEELRLRNEGTWQPMREEAFAAQIATNEEKNEAILAAKEEKKAEEAARDASAKFQKYKIASLKPNGPEDDVIEEARLDAGWKILKYYESVEKTLALGMAPVMRKYQEKIDAADLKVMEAQAVVDIAQERNRFENAITRRDLSVAQELLKPVKDAAWELLESKLLHDKHEELRMQDRMQKYREIAETGVIFPSEEYLAAFGDSDS